MPKPGVATELDEQVESLDLRRGTVHSGGPDCRGPCDHGRTIGTWPAHVLPHLPAGSAAAPSSMSRSSMRSAPAPKCALTAPVAILSSPQRRRQGRRGHTRLLVGIRVSNLGAAAGGEDDQAGLARRFLRSVRPGGLAAARWRAAAPAVGASLIPSHLLLDAPLSDRRALRRERVPPPSGGDAWTDLHRALTQARPHGHVGGRAMKNTTRPGVVKWPTSADAHCSWAGGTNSPCLEPLAGPHGGGRVPQRVWRG